MAAAPAPSESGGGGTAGGKIVRRRRMARDRPTPYSRPVGDGIGSSSSLLRRIPFVGGGMTTDIASRLVGSASRVLTSSASYLFSSIFKRNDFLPIANGDFLEGGNPVEASPSIKAEEDNVDSINGLAIEENDIKEEQKEDELMEIEELIKDKKLSRQEFSRLTRILRSRVVDTDPALAVSSLKDQRHFQEDYSMDDKTQLETPQIDTQRWREERRKAWEEKENPLFDSGLSNNALLPYLKTSGGVLSSPVEVARAFMGERSSRITRPTGSIYGRSVKNDFPIRTLDLSQRTERVFENMNKVPLSKNTWRRTSGSYATPYSRSQLHSVRPRVALQHIQTASTSSREMLKRKSSLLDESWETVDPVRRTRLKRPSAETSNNFGTAGTTSRFAWSNRNLLFSDSPLSGKSTRTEGKNVSESRNDDTFSRLDEKKMVTMPTLVSVPVQSSETARKILETLEKMTPSPKGKVLDEELALVRERLPIELTPSMLNERTRNSMLLVDFPKPCESGPSSSKVTDEHLRGTIKANAARKTEDINNKGTEIAMPPVSSLYSTEANLMLKEKSVSHSSVSEYLPSKAEGFFSSSKPESTLATFIQEQPGKQPGSMLKFKAPDGSASTSDCNKCFRISAVFEESNSDDEAHVCANDSSKVRTVKPIRVSTITDTASREKQIATVHESYDDRNGTSPELTTKASVLSFTFPLNSPPGTLFDPPTPKPMFSSFSTATGSTMSAFPSTFSSEPSSKIPTKGLGFSFTGNEKYDEASTKPSFLHKHNSKSERVVSIPGTATPSSLQFTDSEQVLADSEFKSLPTSQSASVHVAHPSNPNAVSTISCVGADNQLSWSATGSTSAMSSTGSLPSLFSEASQAIGWTSSSTGSNTFVASPSSQLLGANSSALSSISGFGHENPLFQSGSNNKLVSCIFDVEAGKPRKRSFTGAGHDDSKNVAEDSAAAIASANAASAGYTEVAVTSSMVATLPINSAPTSLSSPGSNIIHRTSAFSESFAHPAVTSGTSDIFGGTSVAATFGLSTSTPSLVFPFPGNSTSDATSVSNFRSSITGTLGLPGSMTGASSSFGISSSPFGLATASAAGMATFPAFGMTTASGTSTSPAFGTLATTPAFGSAATVSFGSSSMAFGSSSLSGSAKPFGSLAADTTSKSTSLVIPFCSGFGTTLAAFGSSTVSSSGFSFGGSSVSTPVRSSFSSSSSLSSSPFAFAGKVTPVGQAPLFVSGAFGSSAPVVASGDTSQNDQMNMEDSMAEEPPEAGGNMTHVASPFLSTSGPAVGGFSFNTQSTAATSQSVFPFGSPAGFTAAGHTAFTFSAQPISGAGSAPVQQNAFGQTVNLDFGGGGFAPGATGGEKSGRKFIKARRTVGKRGK